MGAASSTGGAAPGYVIENSVMGDGVDGNASQVAGTEGDRRTFTIAGWIKRTALGAEEQIFSNYNGLGLPNNRSARINFASNDKFEISGQAGASNTYFLYTNAVFRDPSAWLHFQVDFDTTNSVESLRIVLRINGEVQSFSTATYPAQDHDTYYNWTSTTNYLFSESGSEYDQMYLAQLVQSDGVLLDTNDLIEINSDGVAIAKDISSLNLGDGDGTSGLWDFADSSDLGKDVSGNNNNWTDSFAAADQTTDTPTDSGSTIGNYATLNPLIQGSLCTLSNGNLTVTGNSASNNGSVAFTQYVEDGGLYYYEITMTTVVSEYPYPGVIEHPGEAWINTSGYASSSSTLGGFHAQAGATYIKINIRGVYTAEWGADPWANGDIVTIAIDDANGAVYLGSDSSGSLVWQNSGDPTSGASKTGAVFGYTPGASTIAPFISSFNGSVATINTGQSAFTYTPPTGYKALGTVSRPAPSISKPSDQFLPMIYEGNGGGQRVGNFIPFTDVYAVDNSCVFVSGDSDYLQKTLGAGNDELFTMSFWWKPGIIQDCTFLNAETDANNRWRFDTASSQLQIYAKVGGTVRCDLITDIKLKDPSMWYNVVLVWDLSEGSGDRVKIFVNGVSQSITLNTEPSSSYTYTVNTAIEHEIGSREGSSIFLDGYLSEVVFIDGTAETASDFGQTDTSTNRWIPKDPSGLTFGTNGFYLEFGTAADLGDDTSGKGNDWAESTSLGTNNQTDDTPTKNFATLNPNESQYTLSNGNLTVGTTSTQGRSIATLAPTSGKWYFEFEQGADANVITGFSEPDASLVSTRLYDSGGIGWAQVDIGQESGTTVITQNGSSNQIHTYRGNNGTGAINVMVALDIDNLLIWYGKGGTWFDSIILPSSFASIGDLTAQGGLAAAFDNTYPKAWTSCAVKSGTPTTGYIGKDWGSAAENKKKIAGFWIEGSSDDGLISTSGTTTVVLYGSDSAPSDSTDGTAITGGSFAATDANSKEFYKFSGITTSTAYRYHWLEMSNSGGGGDIAAAQVQFYELTDVANGIGGVTITPQSTGYAPAVRPWSSAGGTMNFGSSASGTNYTAPTDFNLFNQDNMAENTAGITGLSWIKNRDVTGDDFILQDRVRGIYEYLISNDTDIEATDTNSVQRFLQQGVEIGNMDEVNTSAESFVLWQWVANGTGSSNTDGDLASSVSVNSTAGFSVVSYTGHSASTASTVGHGLGATADLVIVKNRAVADGWSIYHKDCGATEELRFTATAASSNSAIWNNTAPSTSAPWVFTVGTSHSTNGPSEAMIAYAFKEIEGYSKFGKYEGNGDADGTFVYTGFRPSYLVVKNIDATGNWWCVDAIRSTYNQIDDVLFLDSDSKEEAYAGVDFTANGFKLRSSSTSLNGSNTFVYAAFAEFPFGGSGVAQAKAR